LDIYQLRYIVLGVWGFVLHLIGYFPMRRLKLNLV